MQRVQRSVNSVTSGWRDTGVHYTGVKIRLFIFKVQPSICERQAWVGCALAFRGLLEPLRALVCVLPQPEPTGLRRGLCLSTSVLAVLFYHY